MNYKKITKEKGWKETYTTSARGDAVSGKCAETFYLARLPLFFVGFPSRANVCGRDGARRLRIVDRNRDTRDAFRGRKTDGVVAVLRTAERVTVAEGASRIVQRRAVKAEFPADKHLNCSP